MSEHRTSIAVIGPGAIGTTVAAALHETGRTPRLFGRSVRGDLVLHTSDATIAVPGPVTTDPASVQEQADVVFLAVKATQLDGAAAWLSRLCGPDTVVCVLQNGIEQVDQAGPLAPDATVLPAVVWFPAERAPDGSVRLRGEPRLTLPSSPGSHAVADVLAGTRCIVEVRDDFTTLAWRKLLQNAAAGVMALTGRRAGVYRRDDVADLTRRYLEEGLAVARADGADLTEGDAAQILRGFQQQPADMGTSILADREAGRALEWRVRNDVVRRRARRHGVPTPIGDVIVPLLAATSDGPG